VKTCLILCLATIAFTFTAAASEQTFAFPKNQPLIEITIPDGWLANQEGDILQAAASESLDTLLTVRPLAATKDRGSEAIAEIKDALAEPYGDDIEYDALEEGGAENLGFYILNATAKIQSQNEGNVTVYINSIMITFPDTNELLLAQFLSTETGAQENGAAIASIISSISNAQQ